MLIEILCVFLVLVFIVYRYYSAKYKFWEERNVPGPKPELFFGNGRDILLGNISIGMYLDKLYKEYRKEPMVGVFMGRHPALVLHDAELIKTVLIREFSKFANRPFLTNDKKSPMTQHLVALERDRWRPLRAKLAPIFTTGKLKDMCAMIVECSEHLKKYLEVLMEKDEVIDVRDLTARFTTDVIGCCAFGIDTKAMAEENSEFRKLGRLMFNTKNLRTVGKNIERVLPLVGLLINRFTSNRVTHKFFMDLVLNNIEYRKKHKIFRNDFIDILMELREHPESLLPLELTDEILVAQAIVFFAAGFETSSASISHGLYELALNQDVQDKLRAEIKEHMKKNKGDLTYETIKEIKYLDKVFKETLRKYPAGTLLVRQSMTEYTFEGSNVTIPPNITIFIPLYGIHHDPDIYPDPLKFDPERFDEEAEKARNPMHYLPFGDGPRICIGSRFALYQTKVGLLRIIDNYKVEVCDKTMIPYEVNARALVLAPKYDLFLKFTKIE